MPKPKSNWLDSSSSMSPDLDTALEWAARYPGKVVEVRPNLSPRGENRSMMRGSP
jgi:hypothetical protein